MATTPHYTRPNRSHGGSSLEEIKNEPDWSTTHKYRIGFRDRHDRHTGYTHAGDDTPEEREFLAQAKKEAEKLQEELGERQWISVREFMTKQEDYHLRLRQDHPPGWRYVLHTTEDFVKYQQDWPINIKRRQKEEEEENISREQQKNGQQEPEKEHESRRNRGENETHNPAHAAEQNDKYTPQERSLLSLLQSESEYIKALKENDGMVNLPVVQTKDKYMSIDEADQCDPITGSPGLPISSA
ncbi:Hypothetical protein PENO1_090980 [Penicillium occitanis (nom. inval.)]|nr:Hypothetical protein PENO1_090980 [Penicillium occitanis (nom. inval.)]PCG92343.1 hypothetical protein PENOC_092980 [Penicillium occitanis (nom. inval.)]